jgi:hypothetical protein
VHQIAPEYVIVGGLGLVHGGVGHAAAVGGNVDDVGAILALAVRVHNLAAHALFRSDLLSS